MKLVLYLIGRLFVIGFALLLALLAGSLFIGFGLVSGMFPELANTVDGTSVFSPDTDRTILAVASFVVGTIASFQLAGLATLPVTIAIAISELMRWQSMTVHLVLGGLCALFVMFSALALPQGAMPANGTVIVSLASGFVAAFFYWLIAGRNSGEWLSALGEENPHSEG
ncbi:MAG: hypothetical protein QNJ29_00155 [Rhizobiaceae bacterium]|nr:hypothetical protein [Rhizobiaceae bacterium]